MITKEITRTITETVNYATFEDLEAFLAKNNCLSQYMTNLYKRSYCPELLKKFVTKEWFMESGLVSEDFISGAFSWALSEEGASFWNNINDRYHKYLKENNIQGFC